MNFVKQKAEIIEKSENKINNIANIARVCYKSENKSDDESNKRLIENLIKNKHFAMLEHEDYIFYFADEDKYVLYCDYIRNVELFFGIKLNLIIAAYNTVSGNIRAWRNFLKYVLLLKEKEAIAIDRFLVPDIFRKNIFFEDILGNNDFFIFDVDGDIRELYEDDLTSSHNIVAHCRVSVKIICDRGISHELVRHRAFSFAQESTRYVNYSKKEIEFIDYADFKNELKFDNTLWHIEESAIEAEERYKHLINMGETPQISRSVLPHNLKTEIVMTGNVRAWLHFFNLRLFERTGKAHPMIKELAGQLYNDFENKTPISKKLIDNWATELWENEQE